MFNDKFPPEVMEETEIALTPKTDFDASGGVDFDDFAVFASNMGNDCTSQSCGPANLDDRDNVVNWSDLSIFVQTWLWGK